MIRSPAAVPTTRSGQWCARCAWALLAVGVAAVVATLLGGTDLQTVLGGVGPVAAIGAVVVGALRHPERGSRWPWVLIATALAAFLGGAVVRVFMPGISESAPTAASFVPDILVVPGYALLVWALMTMLRRRCATQDDPARTDAWLIGVGAALIVWAYLVAPAIWSTAHPNWLRILAGVFPVVDVLILVIVIYLVMADGVRTPSLWLVAVSTAAMFAADLMYVVSELGLGASGPALTWFNALVLAGYVAMGSAALHPSMRTLVEPQDVTVHDLGIARGVTLSIVMIAPTLLAFLSPPANDWNRLVCVGLTVVFAAMVVWRIVRTTTSWRRADEAGRWRATHDPLTGLANRELLSQTLTTWGERAKAEGKDISLLFVDLDRFKTVNDLWGHQVGDEVLCAVAGRLSAAIRGDDLVCRIGADKFVIALATSSPAALAATLAQRLVEQFTQPFTVSVGDVNVTPSIGVATTCDAVTDAVDLIIAADMAMYEAKDAGRNRWHGYDVAFRDRTRRKARLEQALRGALERHELSVHYQPIINLRDDTLTGFEALMRWNHPELGLVSPVEFIPIAEETGMIVSSGAWLLEQAAAQLVTWQAQRAGDPLALHVSVNLSVRQLHDPTLITMVRGVLDRTGLPVQALWLEVTESGAMDDPEACLAILRELRDLGVTICIDDFGTGYSSLSYLTKLPAHIVKIDRSLVADLGTGGENEAVVKSVLTMAHLLDREVVAEGVETAVQRDWLRDRGCDLVQGYLYGAPRTAAAQQSWITPSLVVGQAES
jgi:diguanylate cyclase (GGDEF)-like protein